MVVFALGSSKPGMGQMLEDFPEACRMPLEIKAVEIPHNQIDLGAWEWDPGTAELPGEIHDYVAENSHRLFVHFAGQLEDEDWQETDCPYSVSQTIGPIYRVPITEDMDVYAYIAQGSFAYANIHLLLYDRINESISGPIYEIYGKWNHVMDHPAKIVGSWVDFEDLDGDGRPELRIAQVLHNGNVYNAIAHHYFDLVDFALRRELVVEFFTRAIGGGHIERRITERSPERVVLLAEWFDENGQLELSLGLPLIREGNGQPFQSELEDLVNPRGILTYCYMGPDVGPNHFFRYGCAKAD